MKETKKKCNEILSLSYSNTKLEVVGLKTLECKQRMSRKHC